jgi:hypothetical protein
MTNDQPTRFTREAAQQIQETVSRQRGALRPDRVFVPPAAPHGDVSGGVDNLFPVIIAKDGGSDGGSSTRATWTYTVDNIDGDELATAVAVAKPRPIGPLHYGDEIASPAYGTAFYNSAGTLLLWDAGEVPNLTALSPLTAWQVDATSGEIQTKSRPILVPATGNETAWTKLDDTTESKTIECTEPGS